MPPSNQPGAAASTIITVSLLAIRGSRVFATTATSGVAGPQLAAAAEVSAESATTLTTSGQPSAPLGEHANSWHAIHAHRAVAAIRTAIAGGATVHAVHGTGIAVGAVATGLAVIAAASPQNSETGSRSSATCTTGSGGIMAGTAHRDGTTREYKRSRHQYGGATD